MIAEILICVAGFLILVVYHGLKRKKGRVTLSLFFLFGTIAYFFLYQKFSIQIFSAFLLINIPLTLMSIEDLSEKSVPIHQIVIFGITLIILRIFLIIPWYLNLFAIALCFILLGVPYLITRGKGLGLGDVLVFGLIGIVATPLDCVILFLFTVIFGLAGSVTHIIITKKKEPLPLIPFIQISILLYFAFRDEILLILQMTNLYNIQFL